MTTKDDQDDQDIDRLLGRLADSGVITPAHRSEAAAAATAGGNPAQFLITHGYATYQDVFKATVETSGWTYISLADVVPTPAALKCFTRTQALKYSAVPVEVSASVLVVAIDAQQTRDLAALDDVRRIAGKRVDFKVATTDEIRSAIARHYRAGEQIADLMQSQIAAHTSLDEQAEVRHLQDQLTVAEEAPVVKFANLIMEQAIRDRASDVHIEPDEHKVWLRYRVDGAMIEQPAIPKHMQAQVVSRFKVMTNLDITQHSIPQDGRCAFPLEDGSSVNLRVAVIPTQHGEKIVLRVLNNDMARAPLADLNFSDHNLKLWNAAATEPNGMILVTGPTGSGKSSTLYATLNVLNKPDVSIYTIEDPVEYQFERISQMSINPKAGLTFAGALRAIVRGDPDVILVGEIRDGETATTATQAALTGHLVLSTLHTSDSAGAIHRLQELGTPAFLIASALRCVAAQRLVRRLCLACRVPWNPTTKELELAGFTWAGDHDPSFFKPAGCDRCRDTGYAGRLAIHEVLRLTPEVRHMVSNGATTDEIRNQALQEGLVLLREDGWTKVGLGLTSVDDVLRTTREKD